MNEYVISGKDAGKRVDRFVAETRPDLSRIFILKAIRLKKIKRNGKRTEGNERLEAGDHVTVYVADREKQPLRTDGFSVVYEDDHVLLVDKRRGILCEDSTGKSHNTLLTQVNGYLAQKGEPKAALCHRIDYNTSGLVILAKDRESLAILEEAIREREIEKSYLCVACGVVKPSRGTLKHQLFKDARRNQVYLSDEPVKGSKTAITHYRALASRNGLSLVECELVTGRTHQIRSQMAHAGWPLLGDEKYGSKAANKPYGERKQLLCSYKITFHFSRKNHILDYLEGKTIRIPHVDFEETYFGKNGNGR